MGTAVCCIHERCNVKTVLCRQLSAVMAGLTNAHIVEHGYDSILCHSEEPSIPSLLHRLLGLQSGASSAT